MAANPPPQGFQTVVPPTDIPTEIPPVDLNERFDPKDFTGKGVEGGIAAGVVGGTGPVDQGEVFLAAEVDDPASRSPAPMPRYPPVLQRPGSRAGSTCSTSSTPRARRAGLVQGASSSTHKAFVEPAKEAIMKASSSPASRTGQPVRVLVQQRDHRSTGSASSRHPHHLQEASHR